MTTGSSTMKFIYINDLVKHIFNYAYTIRNSERRFSDLHSSEELHLFHTLAQMLFKSAILVSNRHKIRRLALPLDSNSNFDFAVQTIATYLEYFMSFEFHKEWVRSKSLEIARRVVNNPELQQTEYNSIDLLIDISYEDFVPFLKKNGAQNSKIHQYWKAVHKIQDRLKDGRCQYFLSLSFKVFETDPTQLLEIGFAYLTRTTCSDNYEYFAKHYVIKENEHLTNTKYVQSHTNSFSFGKSEILTLEYALRSLQSYFSEAMSHPDDFYVVVFGSHLHLRHFQELKVPKKLKYIHETICSFFDEDKRKTNVWDVMKKYREYHREDKFSSLHTAYYEDDADFFSEDSFLGNAGNDSVATMRIFEHQISKRNNFY